MGRLSCAGAHATASGAAAPPRVELMPPRSPLPRRNGLDASWIRTPDNVPGAPAAWATMGEYLDHRLGAHLDVLGMLRERGLVDATGRPWLASDRYRGNAFVWFHRERAPELPVPFPLTVLHADGRIVVVDKPHFLATTPRGAHVTQSVVAILRQRLGLPDLVPAHRLDRLTAGVLLLTVDRSVRGAYAGIFASRSAEKTYEAIAGHDPSLTLPRVESGRIVKNRGNLQAELVAGEPNAITRIELLQARGGLGRYRLRPATGKTHQLRLQLSALGIPIVGDPLYPEVRDVDPDDFSTPLRLVARDLRFTDPIDGRRREFASSARLDWPSEDSRGRRPRADDGDAAEVGEDLVPAFARADDGEVATRIAE